MVRMTSVRSFRVLRHFFFLMTLKPRVRVIHKSMSLKYEPALAHFCDVIVLELRQRYRGAAYVAAVLLVLEVYRGTSLIKNSAPQGPRSVKIHRALWRP